MGSPSKGKRILVRMKSTAKTGYFYTTELNKFNREQKNPNRLYFRILEFLNVNSEVKMR